MDFENLDFTKSGYISNEQITTTVQLALILKKPILIEGPPGTGKTALALATAKALNRKLLRIQCFEGIDFVQIIGEFNYKKQLLQLQKDQITDKDNLDIFSKEFFIPRPLFEAYTSEEPVVLLIDELDSADEEFFAYLLEALGEQQITIPELGTYKSTNPPIVFMTSNNRQDIPEALRRRALYLFIDFPSMKREMEIIKVHIPSVKNDLVESIVYIIQELRKLDLRKQPSISESIDWVQSLFSLNEEKLTPEVVDKTISVIVKHFEDLDIAKKKLIELVGSN